MNAVDTKLWLYAVDHREPIKRQRAYNLLEELARTGETVLPWQVASEFVSGLRRWESKQVLTAEKVNDFVSWMIEMFPIVTPQHMTVLTALAGSRQQQPSAHSAV